MRTILAIDDQKDNLTTISAIVKSHLKDCNTISAISGEEGIQMAKKHSPDVILLDIIMPKMDGYVVCKKFKSNKLTTHIPIIMLTAIKTDMDSRVKALNLGADAFLSKPIDAVELTAQINVMLRIKKAEDKLRHDKKLTQLALDEKSNFANKIIESSALSTWISDEKGTAIQTNQACLDFFGATNEEVIGKYNLFNDEVLKEQGFLPDIHRVFEKGEVANLIIDYDFKAVDHVQVKNATHKIINSIYTPIIDNKGNVSNVIVQAVDLTDIKKAEEKLKDNEYLLRESQKIAALGSYVLNLELESWSSSAVLNSVFGINDNFIKSGDSWLEIVHSEDREMMNDYFAKNVLTNHESFNKEYRIKRINDQVERWVHGLGELEFDDKGQAIRMIGTIQDITERKLAEETLALQSKRLSYIIDGTNAGTWDWNIQTGELTLNERWAEIMGYTLEELKPINVETWAKNVHDEDLIIANKALENLFSKKIDYYNVEFRQPHKDGSWVWVNAKGKITEWTEAGKPLRMSGTHLDITQRKRAQEALHLTQFSTDNSTDAVFWITSDAKFSYVNSAAFKSLGYSEEELLKLTVMDVDYDFTEVMWEAHWKELQKKKTFMIHTTHQRKDKSTFPVEVTVNLIEYGDQQINCVIAKNITERTHSEQVQKILFNISNAVSTSDNLESLISLIQKELGTIIDTKNYYVAFYDETTKMISLPYMSDEKDTAASFPIGKTMTGYVIRKGKTLLASATKQEELVKKGELEFVGPRSKIWLGVPLKIDGKVTGVLALQSYTDEHAYNESDAEILEFMADQISISIERKRIEEGLKLALEQAKESDRLKSAFLATMSHELRTPLNAIIGFSDIITEDLSMEEVISFNNTINSSGKHLLNIVEDLFDVTLIETGEIKIIKKDFDLLKLLDEVDDVITFEQNKIQKENLALKRIIPSDINDIILNSDPSRIKQIVINLLKNALKFTNTGEIQYGCVIEEINKQNMLKFFVKDTGIGVSNEKQQFIFDMFRQVDDTHTRAHGGTGIGLSISKKLTELLGGDIWLESTKGKGSTFFFTIPYSTTIESPEKEKLDTELKPSIDKSKESISILVVEDIEASYEYLKIILKKSGYKTLWAKNGKESIEISKNNQDIDLVLMDINMPVMNGYEAAKELKRIYPDLPIIAQTAYAIAGDREKALENGCDDYISKPIKRDELILKIEKLLKV